MFADAGPPVYLLEFNIRTNFAKTQSVVAGVGGPFDLVIFAEIVAFPTYEIKPVSAVPLPAGGLLLLSAFGGVAALKRRKKSAAALRTS